MSVLSKIMRAGEGKILRKLHRIADQVNSIEEDFVSLSDAELRALTDEYKQRYADGESLDDLLPEAFATVREAAKRVLGQRHYDVQMVGQGTKVFQHPDVGPMTLDYEAMELTNTGGQRMIAYYTMPGTADRDAVALLDMIGSGLLAAGVDGLQQFAQPADGDLVELGEGTGVAGGGGCVGEV